MFSRDTIYWYGRKKISQNRFELGWKKNVTKASQRWLICNTNLPGNSCFNLQSLSSSTLPLSLILPPLHSCSSLYQHPHHPRNPPRSPTPPRPHPLAGWWLSSDPSLHVRSSRPITAIVDRRGCGGLSWRRGTGVCRGGDLLKGDSRVSSGRQKNRRNSLSRVLHAL